MPHMPYDLEGIILAVGYIGLFAIIFAESGLLIGFFLPGDSLLFTAGFLASQGYFDIGALVALSFVAAVLGDSVGYTFGYRVGPRIFTRDDSWFFNKNHLARAEAFYERHGGKTIILARFMPVIRTFAPIVAGVGRMRYSLFLFYNVAGGALWGIGMPSLGYFLGNVIPDADRYIVYIVLFIILTSFIPPAVHFFRSAKDRQRVRLMIRRKIGRIRHESTSPDDAV